MEAKREEGAADVVCALYGITWDGARARGFSFPDDRLALGLLGHPDVDRVLVAEPYRAAPVAVVRRALGARTGFPADERRSLYSPLRLGRRDPAAVARLKRLYERYSHSLARAVRRRRLTRPTLLTSNPFLAAYGDLEWASGVTFYAYDYWPAHSAETALAPAYEDTFRRIVERGHAVCAVSQPILDRMSPRGPARVVPNGVTVDEWTERRPAPDWMESLPHPRAVYVGTIDGRLDVGMVEAAAGRLSTGVVVVVGPVHDTAQVAELRRIPNVVVHPPVTRSGVQAIMWSADVALLPHRQSPLTECMSPLKVYEALAAGKPVAAVNLPPVRGIHPWVELVQDGDFGKTVTDALARGPMPEALRSDFLERNDAMRRAHEVVEFALQHSRR